MGPESYVKLVQCSPITQIRLAETIRRKKDFCREYPLRTDLFDKLYKSELLKQCLSMRSGIHLPVIAIHTKKPSPKE